MALLNQMGSRHALIGVAVAGLTGFGSLATSIFPWNWSISGTISSSHNRSWEHPLRSKILDALDLNPGICYRQLQRNLNVANGTLRHLELATTQEHQVRLKFFVT